MPQLDYDEGRGLGAVDGLLSNDDVASVRSECERLLLLPESDRHPRDKVAHGTRHLSDLAERSPIIDALVQRRALLDEVAAIIGKRFEAFEVSFRSPQPGFGAQKLHADDVPNLDNGPDRVATAIVALVDFTEENGSTRLIPGSHRRVDLQRRSGSLDRHPDEIRLLGSAGTAFVFSGHVLHSGTRNDSTSERPALQLVWRASWPHWKPQ